MDRATYDRMRTLQEGHWWFKGRERVLRAIVGPRVSVPPNGLVLGVMNWLGRLAARTKRGTI